MLFSMSYLFFLSKGKDDSFGPHYFKIWSHVELESTHVSASKQKNSSKNIFNGLLKEIMFISRLNYRPTKNSSGETFTLCLHLCNISKIYYK